MQETPLRLLIDNHNCSGRKSIGIMSFKNLKIYTIFLQTM